MSAQKKSFGTKRKSLMCMDTTSEAIPRQPGFFRTVPSLYQIRQLPGHGMRVSQQQLSTANKSNPSSLPTSKLSDFAELHVVVSVDTEWVARRFAQFNRMSARTDLGVVGDIAFISLHAVDPAFRARAARCLELWRQRRKVSGVPSMGMKRTFCLYEPSIYVIERLPNEGVSVSDAAMKIANTGLQVWDIPLPDLDEFTDILVRECVDTKWVAAKFSDTTPLLPDTDIGVIANFAYVAHHARSEIVRRRAYIPYAQWRLNCRVHYGPDCDACVDIFHPDMNHKHNERGYFEPGQQAHFGKCMSEFPDDDAASDDDDENVLRPDAQELKLLRGVSCTFHDFSIDVAVTRKKKRRSNSEENVVSYRSVRQRI